MKAKEDSHIQWSWRAEGGSVPSHADTGRGARLYLIEVTTSKRGHVGKRPGWRWREWLLIWTVQKAGYHCDLSMAWSLRSSHLWPGVWARLSLKSWWVWTRKLKTGTPILQESGDVVADKEAILKSRGFAKTLLSCHPNVFLWNSENTAGWPHPLTLLGTQGNGVLVTTSHYILGDQGKIKAAVEAHSHRNDQCLKAIWYIFTLHYYFTLKTLPKISKTMCCMIWKPQNLQI